MPTAGLINFIFFFHHLQKSAFKISTAPSLDGGGFVEGWGRGLEGSYSAELAVSASYYFAE